ALSFARLSALYSFFFLLILRPPTPTLFPYTTLFRSYPQPPPHPQHRQPGRLRPSLRAPRPVALRGEAARVRRAGALRVRASGPRSEEHTSELQSRENLVCRLLLEKKNKTRRVRARCT